MGPADPARVAQVQQALRAQGLAVRADQAARDLFGRDESDLGCFPPHLVAFPEDTAQVQAVFRACLAHGVPLTPVGARTGKSGGSLPVLGGVALSLERLNRVLGVFPEELVAVAQPGVALGELQRQVEARGLFYPPDPNSQAVCSLGGTVAENAGGPRALKYGVTRDYVLGLEWVLPTGEVVRVGHRTHKGVAGYDLTALFVGSEGTLGVATEVTVKLLPLPRAVRCALVPFESVAAAAAAVDRVLAGGALPRALELVDDVALAAVRRQGLRLAQAGGALVIVECDGPSDDGVLAELSRIEQLCRDAFALEALVAADDAQREEIWALRRAISPALRALEGKKRSEDVVVPRSKLAEAIAAFKALGTARGLTVATYGHAGDGNLHTNVLFNDEAQRPAVDGLLEAIVEATVALGGTITGEHGVGLAKKELLRLEQPEALIDLQRRLQGFFDPSGLLNPGKLFPSPK